VTKLLIGAGGCAVVAAVVLSPLTIVAALALVFIIKAVCRGVPGDERRMLLWILVVAVALRVAAIGALFLWSDPSTISSFPFDGDGVFLKQRSLWIRNTWLGVAIDQSQFQAAFGSYGWTSYAYVLAYVQYLLGPAPYAVHLLSVCWTVAASGLLYRLVRGSFGSAPAFVALVLNLFLPTLFAWSISAMKEAWILLLTVVVLVSLEQVVRGHGWLARAAGGVGVTAGALILGTTRVGGLFIVVGAMVVAVAGSMASRRTHTLAASAVVLSFVGPMVLALPSVQIRVLAQVRTAAELHIGHVNTEGYAYELLDQRFYSGDSVQSMTLVEGSRFVLRALVGFVAVPLPWDAASLSQVLFIPQQLLWYLLLPLAAVGAVTGGRRDLLVPWLFVGVISVGALVIAPHEGNVGTLVRHRDGLLPFVVGLSAITIASVYGSVRRRAFDLAERSAVARGAHRMIRSVVPSRVSDLRSMWRESALASAVDELRVVEQWQWLRRLGAALLAGAALALVLGPFGDQAPPSLFAWGVTVVCSLVLMAYPRALATAFSERWTGPGTDGHRTELTA
jgi:hypothetical protein